MCLFPGVMEVPRNIFCISWNVYHHFHILFGAYNIFVICESDFLLRNGRYFNIWYTKNIWRSTFQPLGYNETGLKGKCQPFLPRNREKIKWPWPYLYDFASQWRGCPIHHLIFFFFSSVAGMQVIVFFKLASSEDKIHHSTN
jgi:hypothetical protein